ncbi:hypothetical protein BCV72DRAFT_304135 [Rhizopus microsporus var. microsporus]|uniref:Uncharacterized protein n=2 Tax=Rhizopus microsporus TaxID=58291 RepID=A0A2G4SS37_RHIZD|nr:uncharacterized protein RHIMIDRAFT_238264 [Rhizopus microsporus ATCC 52813]ORE07997.1 hypothetical protein BCV72DRAFT_304135 [Rhizopus microsporus var. microsporus]PHZ11597.1 hypothetical protein RHIMIDRAFT_238264 [Rhizopus microsporus ATCC 52813]
MCEKKKQRAIYGPGKTMINRPASWKWSASEELNGSSPKRALTGTEARINVKVGEIVPLLRTKRNHGKTPVQYWKDFVKAGIFNIAQRIRKEIENREETAKEAEDTSAQEQEEQQLRTFSASLLPLLRSDLPADIQDTFLKTI